MNSKRFYFVMMGITCALGLGILVSAYYGNKIMQKQSQKLVAIKLENQVALQQKIALAQAQKDVKKYSSLQTEAKAIVPQDKDQAQTVREIVKIARESGLKLGTISFPASTLGQGSKLKSTEDGGGSSSSANKKTPVTQVKTVPGIKGVFVMPITIQSDPSSKTNYSSMISFLDRLEKNRRTAQVASVTIQPDQTNPSLLTFNLIVNVYIKP